jgi:hypothetical protein
LNKTCKTIYIKKKCPAVLISEANLGFNTKAGPDVSLDKSPFGGYKSIKVSRTNSTSLKIEKIP